MRSFYIALAIVSVLLLSWLFIFNFLDSTITDINKDLEVLQNNIFNNDWNEAEKKFHIIEDKWQNSLKILMVVIDHDEMEKVNHSLEKAKEYIKVQDKSLLVGEIGSLNYLINHVRQKESLDLDNIF